MAGASVKDPHVYQYQSGHGVDAVIDDSIDVDSHPYCKHGPALLFERFFKDKQSKRFFACSACRDRKDCSLFQWEDEKITPGKLLIQQEIKKKLFKVKKHVTQLNEGDIWCFDCGCGIGPECKDSHKGHATKLLAKSDIQSPTQFLNPSDGKKFKAQYFFNDATCQFFLTLIKRLKYKNVLCIGTPRLFELIRATDVSTKLLDIDTRFAHFYTSREFLPYNMYNHFFFDKGKREKTLNSFISSCSPAETVIIVDPPFGGLVNVLERSLKKIWSLFDAETIPTIMVFPYFLEHQVNACLPHLFMHDYKVAYSNHPSYHNDGAQSRGSPVRIYTDIPGNQFAMPTEDYRFCKICQRYVYNGNRHCKACNACTSKNGKTYVHCDLCKACVKPGSLHCETCNACKPPSHRCDTKSSSGCHVCGDLNHKRVDCPSKPKKENCILNEAGQKRKNISSAENKPQKVTGKKKKKSLKKKVKIRI